MTFYTFGDYWAQVREYFCLFYERVKFFFIIKFQATVEQVQKLFLYLPSFVECLMVLYYSSLIRVIPLK